MTFPPFAWYSYPLPHTVSLNLPLVTNVTTYSFYNEKFLPSYFYIINLSIGNVEHLPGRSKHYIVLIYQLKCIRLKISGVSMTLFAINHMPISSFWIFRVLLYVVCLKS